MEKIFFLVLSSLPQTWKIYLAKKFKNIFYSKERIVRFIYSEHNFNPKTNTLKANFVQFQFQKETGKNELSCVRFEFDSIENCRSLGLAFENPETKRNYFGLACTNVKHVLAYPTHSLAFTPKLKEVPENKFHIDIYDDIPLAENGKANSAEVNLKRESFKEIWKPYSDKGGHIKREIQPFNSIKDLIESIKNVKSY